MSKPVNGIHSPSSVSSVRPDFAWSRRSFLGAGVGMGLGAGLDSLSMPSLIRSAFGQEGQPAPTIPSYQRLFPNLPAASFDPNDLARLAMGEGDSLTGMSANPEVMKDKNKEPVRNAEGHLKITSTPENEQDDEENFGIPAGYTYLGQFIDHDLTFNPADTFDKSAAATPNMRTARFDLDSVYGRGPSDQPYLYEDDGRRLKVGRVLSRSNIPSPAHDHPRIEGRAVLGDKRNDENVLVSQMHGVFTAFHNTMAKYNPNMGFTELQKMVTRHYQWVVLNDFLPRICGESTMSSVLQDFGQNGTVGRVKPQLTFAKALQPGEMPLEFADAVYRFGHSMIRPIYRLNRNMKETDSERRDSPAIAGRRQIFAASQYGGLNGFREYPAEWGVDWRLFFEIDRPLDLALVKEGKRRVQASYKIDTSITNPLAFLPEFSENAKNGDLARDANGQPRPKQGAVANLALRNLLRGSQRGLPSGQAVAIAMGLDPIDTKNLRVGKATMEDLAENRPVTDYGKSFETAVPLWYYVLAESQHQWTQKALASSGTKNERDAIPVRLGPVGGRIVAEVMVAMMALDPASVLNAGPDWKPSYTKDGKFGMPELIGSTLLVS